MWNIEYSSQYSTNRSVREGTAEARTTSTLSCDCGISFTISSHDTVELDLPLVLIIQWN